MCLVPGPRRLAREVLLTDAGCPETAPSAPVRTGTPLPVGDARGLQAAPSRWGPCPWRLASCVTSVPPRARVAPTASRSPRG